MPALFTFVFGKTIKLIEKSFILLNSERHLLLKLLRSTADPNFLFIAKPIDPDKLFWYLNLILLKL